MSFVRYIKQWRGWAGEAGEVCKGQGTFLLPRQNAICQYWEYDPREWAPALPYILTVHGGREGRPPHGTFRYPLVEANSCFFPLPSPRKLSTEAEKSQGYKTNGADLQRQAAKRKGDFQKSLYPQAPMFSNSDHVIPLFLV